jgi:diguanylate cyclase (GGDEF)-like protein
MPQCILVVEDEALIAADLQDVLLGFGYDVPTTASTTEEALRAVDRFRPDLVLMDIRLKDGDDGVTTAATIRESWPVPVVFLTSYADDATLARAQAVEPFGYLLKPFNEYELRATVQIVLQRSLRERTAKEQSKALATAVNGAQDVIVAVDLQGRVLFANDAARGATQMSESWASGGATVCLPDTTTPCSASQLPLSRALRGETVSDIELFVKASPDATGCLYSVNAAPLRDDAGAVIGAVAVGRDVTRSRVTLLDLHHLSETDDLTGAYNRRGFMGAATTKLRLAAESGRRPTLFFVDLNDMKHINDTLGHAAGDRAIADTVGLLNATFRTSDVVARLGGDEFVVLVADAGSQSQALRERLDRAVHEFNESGGREYRLSMSVGMAEYDPASGGSLSSLLAEADKQMYAAKSLRGERLSGQYRTVAPREAPPDSGEPIEASRRSMGDVGASGLGDRLQTAIVRALTDQLERASEPRAGEGLHDQIEAEIARLSSSGLKS